MIKTNLLILAILLIVSSPLFAQTQVGGENSPISFKEKQVSIGHKYPTAQLSLGVWNAGDCGNLGGEQLTLSGLHNSGANLGGIKLLIEGYDNDGTVTYPIFLKDENYNVDYWIKNRQSASGVPTMYFAGNIGIGTTSPDYKLDVNGTIRTRELKVDMQGADFVFEDDYNLRSLNDLEEFIQSNKHLPDVAPAKEMQENGVNQSEMNQKLLQKIEELTLYILKQEKRINQLEQVLIKNHNE